MAPLKIAALAAAITIAIPAGECIIIIPYGLTLIRLTLIPFLLGELLCKWNCMRMRVIDSRAEARYGVHAVLRYQSVYLSTNKGIGKLSSPFPRIRLLDKFIRKKGGAAAAFDKQFSP